MHTSISHVAGTNKLIDKLHAVAAKLGIGASTPGNKQVLGTDSSGNSSWMKIDDNYVATGAGILLSKLAAGAAGILRSNGTTITAGNKVTDADLDDDSISLGKLVPGGTANRIVATSDGSTVAMQQIVDAMVSSSAGIELKKLKNSGFGTRKHSDQSINNAVFTSIDFTDTEYFDYVNSGDVDMHDTVTNPSRIYLRYSGIWGIFACAGLNAAATTLMRVRKNGTTAIPGMMWRENQASATGTSLLSFDVYSAGDYVEVQFWHDVSATNIGDYVGGTYAYAIYFGGV